MNEYNQQKVDEKFQALLTECRSLGYNKIANHYADSKGMQRIHAVRFLEALFAQRALHHRQHMQQKQIARAISILATISLLYILWRNIP